ncbi:CD2 antigen cytoplasmic tail-binding protein 2 isoform X1 [Eucalyptus grandis]|uniref:CD2 antigen cytoplasmic tail-binding protein 2 isoform X1 n=1 Tax=Eucalyptus grandis TaxID=71139 RepID=UPI00192EAC71|nr:CD2 antigen cytoplasmic tail-binding protein 2 isoform X1 [Eucalyptus grandis]
MEGSSSHPSRKRPFFEDDPDSSKAPSQKRVRFPKGKKVKPGDEAAVKRPVVEDKGPSDAKDARLAAKERASRRSQITAELFSEDSRGGANDISSAEVAYEDNESFVEDGIQIEPFNLDKEREEGYFDAEGNFVEYVNENEIKDAWLDSVEAVTSLASRRLVASVVTPAEEDAGELSSDDIGKMKRRIANVLEPGETVLQALRRLKGSSNRKEKMSAETKHLFDQLTEDAATLMENGEFNVYHEAREVFEREAEGYERLAWARKGGTAIAAGNGTDKSFEMDLLSEGTDTGSASGHNTAAAGTSEPNASTLQSQILNGGAEEFDMFAEDDEQATTNKSSEEIEHIPHGDGMVPQPSLSVDNAYPETGESQSDYVYDESSGYYYSSSLGYYYDPSTKLYCSAASGQWYAFNEETGTYEEVQADISNTS